MILSVKKVDNLLLHLSLKVGVHFMNYQHLRLKWNFEKLDKYWARSQLAHDIFLLEKDVVFTPDLFYLTFLNWLSLFNRETYF